jgi:hypothetical protein
VASEVTRHLVAIAHLDAQILGTAGKDAANIAWMLHDSITCLIGDIGLVAELRGANIPQQRDNAN